MPFKPAFSVIELLLVAGIISILVSIAVPGYLDAKLRAEVVDTKNTLQKVHHALYLYKVDNNKYPERQVLFSLYNPLTRLVKGEQLATEPVDRFKEGLKGYGGLYGDSCISYFDLDPMNPLFAKVRNREINRRSITSRDIPWFIKSIGPDQMDMYDEGMERGSNRANPIGLIEYDVTNGVFSLGEIFRTQVDDN